MKGAAINIPDGSYRVMQNSIACETRGKKKKGKKGKRKEKK
jgi:hypothetical protein